MEGQHVPHREIACAILFDPTGRLLLQQRDNIPGILCPGMIALFGGHRENDESFVDCAIREIREETGHLITAERLEHLVSFHGIDQEGGGGTLRGEFFVVYNVPSDALVITEGTLSAISIKDVPSLGGKLTPSAQFALNALFADQNIA